MENGFVKENMDAFFPLSFYFLDDKISNKLRWESVSPKEPDDFIFYVYIEHHQLNVESDKKVKIKDLEIEINMGFFWIELSWSYMDKKICLFWGVLV